MLPTRGEQQQTRLPKHVEGAAALLDTMLQEPAVAQLLQQPPGTVWTHEQQDVVTGCADALLLVVRGFSQQDDTSAPGHLLGLALRHKAALNAATLLSWTQQQPQHLPLGLLQQRDAGEGIKAYSPTTGTVWLRGAVCLSKLNTALVQAAGTPQAGCSVAALAAAMLRQLEQSGGRLALGCRDVTHTSTVGCTCPTHPQVAVGLCSDAVCMRAHLGPCRPQTAVLQACHTCAIAASHTQDAA